MVVKDVAALIVVEYATRNFVRVAWVAEDATRVRTCIIVQSVSKRLMARVLRALMKVTRKLSYEFDAI